ncbi:hypothetical protein CcaverHIS002_0200020 [Cutaneotrichosporon cavernicola]|uniref:Serine aminopeptidase S33 domain-containing protein n=1 Tax=Cutaneotrichosporon cavernicola TaxID=279322 RepID=A0AA48I6C0_9TREE|nr:uncharacterized protein CcaverHIS019_0200070 [Cutaneotrichosporon cavernicola]BEI80842.1 hypothetical protein CcaverHIS002_0200020 [Cutaneotrichosporon cavernicola]BEI88645.1 hypothetical protein CcaverHIS019_0200070 [Cutaneotrichosporon cavernicola]BEI96418.1 hypothetical protein CcaverHIS631_0200070 [Cutaneotrichosporon cavernicola]BEJ04190.1 hypothetical protein CcaverHIS641_0200070 [Cutaneotrichosporon cavernicola]
MSDSITTWAKEQAKFFTFGVPPVPIMHSPDEAGLDYEEIVFPAHLDGVPIEGWFIPAKGSKKIIICNHPMTFNRAGCRPLAGFGEGVNLIPDYKHLHDAGYNIVAYDIRNHGRSGSNFGAAGGQGPYVTFGVYESRDVVGSIQYVRKRFPDYEVALYSRCMGANSTIKAWQKYPDEFKDIKTLLALQPVSIRSFIETGAKKANLDVAKAAEAFDKELFDEVGFRLDDYSPQLAAPAVNVPTFVLTVRDDALINAPKDLVEIYDNLGTKEKKIFWIEGTTVRFDGYSYFGSHPEQMVDWFKKYL